MSLLDRKVIRTEKPNGDFYEGIVLNYHPEKNRVKLWVTKSNIDSLRGVTEEGDIIDFWLEGWTVTQVNGDETAGAVSSTLIRRDYRSPDGHLPYQGLFHDANDQKVEDGHLFVDKYIDGKRIDGLLVQAGIKDGDEFELVLRKTGERPFGDRQVLLVADGEYAPETDAQIAFREANGRSWNYRSDQAL
jgi:hypothetical protein